MIPKIESTSNDSEKRRFQTLSQRGNEITLNSAENANVNDFLTVFRDIYKKEGKRNEK